MRLIQALPRAACALLLLAGIGVNFANVIGRYLFAAPLPWAEDFMVFTNIWLIFLGAALASFQDRQLSMDLIRVAIPPRPTRLLNIAIALLSLGISGFTTWISFQFVQRIWSSGQQSISLGIPMYLPHGAILVGFALMTVASLVLLVRIVRTPESTSPNDETPARAAS